MTMKRTLSVEAQQKLVRVAEWLEKGAPHIVLDNGREVETFHMDHGMALTTCGTVCCIAGALVEFNDPFSKRFLRDEANIECEMPWRFVRDRAMHQLGLDPDVQGEFDFANHLFRSGYGADYSFDNSWITPKIAAAVLRDYLLTDTLDWDAQEPDDWDEDWDTIPNPLDTLDRLEPRDLERQADEEDSRESDDIEDLDGDEES